MPWVTFALGLGMGLMFALAAFAIVRVPGAHRRGLSDAPLLLVFGGALALAVIMAIALTGIILGTVLS